MLKTFNSVIGDVIGEADNLLNDEKLCKRINNLSKSILENVVQEKIKKIDVEVQTTRLAVELEPKDRDTALDIIEDKTRLPQLAKEQNFTIAQVIDATKNINQNDLATFVKMLDVVTDKSKIVLVARDYPYIEIPLILNNIKNHPDFFEKYEIALEKLSKIDNALVSTNRFFERLEAYNYESIKYSCSVTDDLKDKDDYTQLRESLYNGGVPKVTIYTNAAHHVVALNAPRAYLGRGILKAVDIDINSASNAVILPQPGANVNNPYIITESIHSTHTREYYRTVNKRLLEALEIYDENLPIIIQNSENEQEITEVLKEYINNNEKIKKELNKIICDCLFDIKIDLLNGELKI